MKISNTTPLIAFAKIGHLSLLQKMVGTIVIPTAVANEIVVYSQGNQTEPVPAIYETIYP